MCSYKFFYAFKACKNIEMLVKSLHAANKYSAAVKACLPRRRI